MATTKCEGDMMPPTGIVVGGVLMCTNALVGSVTFLLREETVGLTHRLRSSEVPTLTSPAGKTHFGSP